AWVGLFVTGLNMLPLSQLDGGHVWYGLLGRGQKMVALVAAAALLAIGGQAPIWFLWLGITFVIGQGSWTHPDVLVPRRPVLRAGRVTGIVALIIFAITFVPFPFPG